MQHIWSPTGILKGPTLCYICENLVWRLGKSSVTCTNCKQVVHSKCLERNTISPCSSNNESLSLFKLSGRTPSFRKFSLENDPLQCPPMELNIFNSNIRNSILAPYPLTIIPNTNPLDVLFSWKPEQIDIKERNFEEFSKLFITLFDTDTSLASVLYQAFYSQKQIHITDNSIPIFIENIYPKIYKKSKNNRKKPIIISNKEPEELECNPSPKNRKSRKLLSSLSGKKKTSNDIRDTIKHNFISDNGSQKTTNCIVIPCSVYGELAISNSPQTLILLDKLFDKSFSLILHEHVENNCLGEMQANSCVILPTINSTILWVCCISYPNEKEYIDSYSLFLNVLSSIWLFNKTIPYEQRIISILCPSFHNPNQLPVDTANRLYVAYRSFITVANRNNPQTFQLIKDKEKRLRLIFNPKEYASYQKTYFIILLLKGDLVKRNFISAKEFTFLLEIIKHDDSSMQNSYSCFPIEILPSIRESAAKVIAYYTFPDQKYRFLRKEVLSNGCLKHLLEFVYEEKIKVHHEIGTNDIIFENQIATGGCGIIYKGKYQGNDVAIKTFRTFTSEEGRIEFFRELGICSILQHDNLIKCYGAHTNVSHKDEERFIVIDLLKRGSLWDIIEKHSNKLTKKIKLNIAMDIAMGMTYLHSQGIIHRDLKSLNILITDDWRAKIIDFGTSRIVETNVEMTNNLGTTYWMAPEVFQSGIYSEADNIVDIYSFAIVLWEILTCNRPYSNIKSWDVPNMVIKGERPPLPSLSNWDEWLIKLLKRCWHQKSHKRPSFDKIIETFTSNIAKSERNLRSYSVSHEEKRVKSPLLARRSRSKSPRKLRLNSKSEKKKEAMSLLYHKDDFELSDSNDSNDSYILASQPSNKIPPRKKKKRVKSIGNTGYASDSPEARCKQRRTSPLIVIS